MLGAHEKKQPGHVPGLLFELVGDTGFEPVTPAV